MRPLLAALVCALPLYAAACASYAIHLYSDPHQLTVIEESLVLTEAETDDPQAIAVLMRGDSVVVIGERRNNWEYEQDMHDRSFIVYYGRRRAYVPYRSLVSREQYAAMFGPGRNPDSLPVAPTRTGVGTGGVATRDTVARPANLTGGSNDDEQRE
jgi:hypothetical protein